MPIRLRFILSNPKDAIDLFGVICKYVVIVFNVGYLLFDTCFV